MLRLVRLLALSPSLLFRPSTGRHVSSAVTRRLLHRRCCSSSTSGIEAAMSKQEENRKKNPSKRRQRGDPYDEAQYATTPDGVRMVVPYTHNFTTYAKGRWIGREIIEVLTREFGGHPKEYWTNALRQGHVMINDQKVCARNTPTPLHAGGSF